MKSKTLSVIIPACGETESLEKLLPLFQKEEDVEIIVSIQSGDDLSRKSAARFGVAPLEAEGGRGKQLDNGARHAAGGILLFCHADTILPVGWKDMVIDTLNRPGVAGGAFRLKFDSSRRVFRLIAFIANLRASFLGLAYGDQALFTTAEIYRETGGFRPLPIMEDVDFVRRLAKLGKVCVVNAEAVTSPRRYEKNGILPEVIRNFFLITFYLLGVPLEKLARWRYGG